MSLMSGSSTGELASNEMAHTIQIQSIEVKYKGKREHRTSIEVRIKDDEAVNSQLFKENQEIKWPYNKRVSSPSHFEIVIREHRRIRSVVKYPLPVTIDNSLVIKPIIVINEPKGKLLVNIHCEATGPFIEIIRRIVYESQNRLENMKVFLESLGKACEFLNCIVNITEALSKFHPAVTAASLAISALYKLCKKQKECHEAAVTLMADIASFPPFIEMPKDRLKAGITSETAEKLLVLFANITQVIIPSTSGTVLGSEMALNNRIKDVNAFKEAFRRLTETFSWCVMTETWKTILRIEMLTEASVLRHLHPVLRAFYNQEKTCFEGSRKGTLRTIEEWSTSESKLFWLVGSAGSGKTTVAHTVARYFDEQSRLAGCFFCDKTDVERSSAERIIPTIAYQFAKWHKDYRSFILDVLQSRDEVKLDSGLECQFDLLVKQPITASSIHLPPRHDPLVIVLDALDECCETVDARRYLARTIRRISAEVPCLKIFVSSKDFAGLEGYFGDDEFQCVDISDPLIDLQYDMASYVKYSLSTQSYLNNTDDAQELKLPQLLSSIKKALLTLGGEEAISIPNTGSATYRRAIVGKLYRIVMENIVGKQIHDEGTMSMARTVLAMISRAPPIMPLTEDVLLSCMQRNHPGVTAKALRTTIAAIRPLAFTDDNNVLHTSFPSHMIMDYVSNHSLSGRFWVEPSATFNDLAYGCLYVLHNQLKFNICYLESSHLTNANIPNLCSLVKAKVPKGLQYSSLYWMGHVLQADNIRGFQRPIMELLCSPMALFWIEVLSLMGAFEKGMKILVQCAVHFKGVVEIVRAATQLHSLISTFRSVIDVSTPHLYISALTWLPQDSIIAQKSRSAFTTWTSLFYEKPQECTSPTDESDYSPLQDADISLLKGSTRNIRTAKYTYGNKIVSSSMSSSDNSIRIWDAKSGEALGEPLQCQEPGIEALAYSPDGNRIASGSGDGKIRIWDAHTGTLVIDPIKGHKRWITAIAYSPNGARIVSDSADVSMRIWDAQSGACIAEPLKHSDRVTTVAYASDGCRVVFGSSDGTLRIWDIQSCEPVGEPLHGHESEILAIAYSPDGKNIVSGSSDKILRIWDVQNGAPIGKPLNGHSDMVRSIVYSPDGTIIVSGSGDGTLRMWNARNGRPIGEPLKGHKGGILTVSYSPDGRRLVSGSNDKTLQIWDAYTREPIGNPLSGHKSWVMSAAYSPDSSRVVSGSADGTIRIWDAYSGMCIKTMIIGESRWDPDAQRFLTITPLAQVVAYTDNPSTIPGDGWLRTLDGGLFLWVPPEHRRDLCNTGQVRIPNDESGQLMAFDWTEVCHGKDWKKVIDGKELDGI